MKEYRVRFTQYYSYLVEAENEDEAFEIAEGLFEGDMRVPVANTVWDDVEVNECD